MFRRPPAGPRPPIGLTATWDGQPIPSSSPRSGSGRDLRRPARRAGGHPHRDARRRGRLTTMPTGRGSSLADGLDVEALGEAGDDQRELHLRQGEADAVAGARGRTGTQAMSASARCSADGSTNRSGSKRERVGPGLRVAAGEVRRPQDERSLGDPVAADHHVDGGLAGETHARPGAGGWSPRITRSASSRRAERGLVAAAAPTRSGRRRRRPRVRGGPTGPGASAAPQSIHASDADVVSKPAPTRVTTWSRISASERAPSATSDLEDVERIARRAGPAARRSRRR